MKFATAVLCAALLLTAAAPRAELAPAETGAFSVTRSVVVPGDPGAVYDNLTGDILPWWDHHMADAPKSLTIDARPGGEFREVFDDSGDGVRHAVVIYAERGKRLTMEGPLGLSGFAVTMVTTYELAAEGDGTRVTVTANCAGQFEPGWDEAVDRTWRHFLDERFKPYMEAGGR